MDITILKEFETALANNDLYALVERMKNLGMNQVEIYDLFDQFVQLLRQRNCDEDQEDKILDVIADIVGWCGPSAGLFSHYLTNEEIETYQRKNSGVSSKYETRNKVN